MEEKRVRRVDARRRLLGAAAPVWALAMGVVDIGPAHGAETVGLSGYELFPGRPQGDVRKNVTFAGTTNAACANGNGGGSGCWTDESNGGNWLARIERRGDAGIGSKDGTVEGGRLILEQSNGMFRVFNILRGGSTIVWPESLNQDIGCGEGIASFLAELRSAGTNRKASLVGCLDDTHLDPRRQPFVFPPRVWGTLTLE
jgi:hypothetical protein